MKSKKWIFFAIIALLVLVIIVFVIVKLTGQPKTPALSETTPAAANSETAAPVQNANESDYQRAMGAFSVERSLEFLTRLTAINEHKGWRGAGTPGESQAVDLVESELANLEWLKSQGMTVERESFNVFVASQVHASSVVLSAGGKTLEIQADVPRGNRDYINLTSQLDSDGSLTDTDENPVQVSGEVTWIPDQEALLILQNSDLSGKVALVNYLLVDTSLDLAIEPRDAARMILDLKPAAIILYTEFSNVNGESHGTFTGDGGGGFQVVEWEGTIPLMVIQVEELEGLGISKGDQLQSITNADVTWDVDVINPATSTNLIVHIPGKEGSKPILLSAHIDSPNSPGALDDGAGSAILMEIATVLNEQQIQPDADLYLAWYGSEEIGLGGSMNFTNTHSALVNDLIGNIQVDCLTSPLDGVPAEITLAFSHYVTSYLEDDPLAAYLVDQAQSLGIPAVLTYEPLASDNGSLTAFNVSNVDIINESDEMYEIFGGPWYAGHLHDPYDTVERVIEVQDVYESMAKLAFSGAFIPLDLQQAAFEDNPAKKQALFLMNETESSQMSAAAFFDLSVDLINMGYEINVMPYGEVLESSDLEGIDLVVVPPVYDLQISEETYLGYAPVNGYDAGWTESEAAAIYDYAQNGGTLMIMNSAFRTKLGEALYDFNEDWQDLNVLTNTFGVTFTEYGTGNEQMNANLDGKEYILSLSPENTTFFSAPAGSVLAGTPGRASLAVVTAGSGKVIVIGDLMMVRTAYHGTDNGQVLEALLGE